MKRRLLFDYPCACCLAGLLACSSPSGGERAPGQPRGYRDGIALSEATDVNPDPSIVELSIEARRAWIEWYPGIRTEALTYDGSLPGPLIRAHRGDRVVVHFKNNLPEPTTIHWHGVRVPANMDGAPDSQSPVLPGETFDYDFRVPDAGLFWYHPHVNSAAQVTQGLYGALVVEDPPEPPTLGDEVVLVLSDATLPPGGGVVVPVKDTLSELFGTEGDVILVNGRRKPRLLARAGLHQRWRLVNAARSRFFELSLAGHSFVRIGGDGGLIEAPIESNTVVLGPGERADVVVTPVADPGTDVALRWIPYDRGFGTAFAREPEDILTLHIDEAPSIASSALPEHLRSIEPLANAGATERRLTLAYRGKGPGDEPLVIQGTDPGQMLTAHVGDTEIWHIANATDWDHPFHLHGFFFQPLDANGTPVHEWKDTLNVPAMKNANFVVHFADRPGNWMFHCHILEHAEIGLTGMLMLEP